jgi:putative endonuclease
MTSDLRTPWTLYLLECRNGSLYTGITNNLEARYQAHLSGKGAKYTRANPPISILATAEFPDRSSASRAEWAIKQQPRHKKREAVLHFESSNEEIEPHEAPTP